MAATANTQSFTVGVNDSLGTTNLNPSVLFDRAFVEATRSPIDTFIFKTRDLTRLVIDPATFNPIIANLVLLGYISALESYFRELIRKTISLDKYAKKACEAQNVTYGAACVHNKEMLPEALIEEYSFANAENIKRAFKDLLGLKGHLEPDLIKALDEFSAICQLRHCLVHRFGKLGSKNAMQLGILEDKEIIEKPIVFTYATLQEALSVCHNTVKAVNSNVLKMLLNRLIIDSNNNDKKRTDTVWTWNYLKDKRLFTAYFNLFLSLENPPSDTNPKSGYNNYKTYYSSLKK